MLGSACIRSDSIHRVVEILGLDIKPWNKILPHYIIRLLVIMLFSMLIEQQTQMVIIQAWGMLLVVISQRGIRIPSLVQAHLLQLIPERTSP